MKHAPWQHCNISYNSTNYAGDVPQSCKISCNNTNNIGYTIETQWRLPPNNKYCFTITPTSYFGSGMQLSCKLLSCYCKQVWYFIGGCSPIQCENNNEDMNGGLSTGAIIGTVLAGIVVTGIVVTGIVVAVYFVIKRNNKNKKKEKKKKKEEQKKKDENKKEEKKVKEEEAQL